MEVGSLSAFANELLDGGENGVFIEVRRAVEAQKTATFDDLKVPCSPDFTQIQFQKFCSRANDVKVHVFREAGHDCETRPGTLGS